MVIMRSRFKRKMAEQANLSREFSVAHWTGQRGCRALRCNHRFFLSRFALLPLQHSTGASPALTEDCTFLDFSSPGILSCHWILSSFLR
ncbi:hypothetical protein SKAU_G00041640 [Synaphobranchus kaupii]|uniref:Uncharacterized protein n=1 Tax=Synaphobranchus kaupii TaxID=118154 RepID=A0A9Q1G286_SYNKA|nr:hypothetical protein SKAU_G00041640 [Synaphobranchus kaupii]